MSMSSSCESSTVLLPFVSVSSVAFCQHGFCCLLWPCLYVISHVFYYLLWACLYVVFTVFHYQLLWVVLSLSPARSIQSLYGTCSLAHVIVFNACLSNISYKRHLTLTKLILNISVWAITAWMYVCFICRCGNNSI